MKKIFKVAEKGLDLIGKVLPDNAETQKLKGEIIKSEIQSDSQFLKNARPSIIYVGLLLITFEYFGLRGLLISLYYNDITMIDKALISSENILEFFLVTWASISTAFVIGRSNEKKNRKFISK
tara:strand:- start:175 stop:543 length:369 start_codon:yes stop_codon:yes gene_type:complete